MSQESNAQANSASVESALVDNQLAKSTQPAEGAGVPAQSNKSHDWKLNRPATVLATLGATAALAVANGSPVKEFDVPNPLAGETPVELVQPDTALGSVEAQDPEVIHNTETTSSAEQWAQFFSEDEQAGELTASGAQELAKVRERIQELEAHGFTIDSVTLEGHSSDEDDSVNNEGARTAGLREQTDQNEELANKRAETYQALLKTDLKAHGEDIQNLEVVAPVEDMLTNAEVEHIDALAEQFGYGQVVTMIEQYNRGENVPPAVNEYLDKVLAQERKVVVTIESSKQVAPNVATPGEEADGGKDSIPLYLPLIVFLPVLTRRLKAGRVPVTEVAAAGGPVPPVVPGRPARKLSKMVARAFTPPEEKDSMFKGGLSLATGHRQLPRSHKQPRPFNFSNDQSRMSRNHGGNRG